MTDAEFETLLVQAAPVRKMGRVELYIGDSLSGASRWLAENIKKHVRCPCCRQRARMYRRKITSAMACVLVLLAHGTKQGEWLHLGEFIAGHKALTPKARAAYRGGDFAKLLYWGMIETLPPPPTSKQPESGIWRVTEIGRRFVSDLSIRVPQAAFTYNEKLYGFTEETVNVVDALGDAFDYDELIRGG